jgi:nuclear transport factor 2 (NTF2) superfamily protein
MTTAMTAREETMLPGTANEDDKTFIAELYAAFNGREVDHLLALMEPQVAWPNGMEGGFETGREAVRAYWTRQWTRIDPQVTPEQVDLVARGQLAVQVHQVIRDLSGDVLSDRRITHLYTLNGFRVVTMEIVAEAA